MLKSKKQILEIILILVAFIAVLAAVLLYVNKYSKDGIYNNVLNQEGYKIYEIQKPVHFTTFIDPDWIPAEENEVIELNKEISQIGNVKIIIESVMHRENDIYFNFDAIPYITYEEGEFLYNATFNEDGTTTSYSDFAGYHIYKKDNMDIDVGQRGSGPNSKFSFGIDIENYDLIADGFNFEYNSSILYGYSLLN